MLAPFPPAVRLARKSIRAVLVLALALPVPAHVAGDGPALPTVHLGMSTALSGPAADLGRDMRHGVEAALAEFNARRDAALRLELTALDDGYEPERTAPNMRKLIEEQRVLAVVGNVGTPTAIAAIPIALEARTLFFGAFTGAGVLRKSPPDRYVINYRASYAEETAEMVRALVAIARIAPEEIAFFTQRDGYGDAGFSGGIAALAQHGLKDTTRVAHGRYERNTLDVEKGLADILLAPVPPRAVIMVGAYAPCAAFIKMARELGVEALFLNVSFVGPQSLARELGDAGEGVIVTQVVPHPTSDVPMAVEYRRALRAHDAKLEPSFGSFEGYVAARVLCHALKTVSGTPDRERIVDALEGLGRFDLGIGAPLELSAREHQACHQVWATVIRGGQVLPFDWGELARDDERR